MEEKEFILKNVKRLCKFLLWFLLGIIIFSIGLSRSEAWTTMNVCSDSALSSCGKYRALDGNGTLSIKTIGTNYSGTIIGFDFFISLNTQINKNYKIRINFYGDDLKSIVNASMVSVAYYDGSSWSDATLVGIQKQNPSGYSTWIDIYFTMPQASSKLWITIDDSENGNDITGISYYGINSVQFEEIDQNTDIMNNANQNANNIINNQNNNTQSIIDNSNSNTQAIIDANMVCQTIDKSNIEKDNYYINVTAPSGVITDSANNSFGITGYINIIGSKIEVLTTRSGSAGLCFYNSNKEIISCLQSGNLSVGELTIPNNSTYFRATIQKSENRPTFKICQNGSQAITDAIQDDDIGDSTQEAADFITDFNTNTFGLTSIITAPLNLIQSLTSSTCNDLELPLPYLDNKKLTLPCMSTIYSQHFGAFFTIYQTITYGIIAYWVIVRIFNQVKDFKNPEHDEIEVVDL